MKAVRIHEYGGPEKLLQVLREKTSKGEEFKSS